jgi:hypothetical protein
MTDTTNRNLLEIMEKLVQIEKELQIQNYRMNEIERKLDNQLSDRLSICESKCESLGYAELELYKGSTCIDENYNNKNIVTHFPLHSKQLLLTGNGGRLIDFTLVKLPGFYNLNHLCLSNVVAIEPYRLERWYIEHKIARIPDDAIFSHTVKTLELWDCTAFDDLKIISRFPNLTKLIVRRSLLSEYIHLILPSIQHTITEIDFINVRCNRTINYNELQKYCNEHRITMKME